MSDVLWPLETGREQAELPDVFKCRNCFEEIFADSDHDYELVHTKTRLRDCQPLMCKECGMLFDREDGAEPDYLCGDCK